MIPEKYFYTIGEVSKLTGTKPHILRYWEEEFKLLRPARRYSGHRKFTQQDIDLINRIRYLVLEKKFSLAGAKRELNRQLSGASGQAETKSVAQLAPSLPLLKELKKEVEECLSILDPEPQPELLEL